MDTENRCPRAKSVFHHFCNDLCELIYIVALGQTDHSNKTKGTLPHLVCLVAVLTFKQNLKLH